jgi:hypothetical protein
VDELGISADEWQILLEISSGPGWGAERARQLDEVIAAAQVLLPFDRGLLLHEHAQRTQVLIYRYSAEQHRKSSRTFGSGQPLRIDRYLESFSRFGTYQHAFFWFARPPRTPVDPGIAAVLRKARLTEGISGAVSSMDDAGRRRTTLVQLQYCQDRFEAKHLVFANLIVHSLHSCFEHPNPAICTTYPVAPSMAEWHARPADTGHPQRQRVTARRRPSIGLAIRKPRRACR